MRRIGHLILLLMVSPMALATQIELGGGMEWYQWEEFADSGRKLLSETGPRYFIEVKGTNRVEHHWWQDFSCRLYSGTVNYDGETMGGTPITTDTDYNGIRAEVGFNYLTKSSRSRPGAGDWLVRFGLGIENWRRGLQDTSYTSGTTTTPVSGYTERYIVSYATVAGQYLGSGWRAGLGVMAPYYVDEEASFLTGTTFHPSGQLSPFANAEFFVESHWSVVLSYDTYRFAKSDVSGGYYQPKSSRDSYTASVRYHF
jgi:hypothetical protein